MIGGYDEAVSMPIVDLYDDGMMSQYINAMQRDYERGYQEQKQFNQEFGDLMSPSYKLNEAFYNSTRGRVYDILNKAQKQGVDLTRSVEGRSIISNVINSIPYDKISDWRRDAQAMNDFQKAKADMITNGTYSDAFQKFYQDKYGLMDINDYDPYDNKRFNQTAPAKYQTLQQFVDPEFAGIKDSDLTPEQVRSLGLIPNKNYNYKGVSADMLARSLESKMPGLRGNDIYDFYREQARQDLINKNRNIPHYQPTEEEVDKQFVRDAVVTGLKHTRIDKSADEFAKMAVNHAYDIDTENRKFGHDVELANLKAKHEADKNDTKGMNDPFIESKNTNAYGKIGQDISYQYAPEGISSNRIQPISSGVRLSAPKGSRVSYTILPGEVNGKSGKKLLYDYNSATTKGEKVKALRLKSQWENTESRFEPTGKLSSKGVYKNGKLIGYRHFIVGQLTRQIPNGTYVDKYNNTQTRYKTIRLNSGKPIAMEVKRKEFNESDTPNRNNY